MNPGCTPCAVDQYQDQADQTSCLPCPANSYAHFTGSTGCLACYFGEPQVVAGTIDGVTGTFPVLLDESPKPGGWVLPAVAGCCQQRLVGGISPVAPSGTLAAYHVMAGWLAAARACMLRTPCLQASAPPSCRLAWAAAP